MSSKTSENLLSPRVRQRHLDEASLERGRRGREAGEFAVYRRLLALARRTRLRVFAVKVRLNPARGFHRTRSADSG